MPNGVEAQVAIVDYGMGNLFSVGQACEQAGLGVVITSSSEEILATDAVILPGVGAFRDAMANLNRLDLASILRDIAASPKPLVGICLGMQLMMSESYEFGRTAGLGIIEGEVSQLEVSKEESAKKSMVAKVPQVGWNQIHANGPSPIGNSLSESDFPWRSPLLNGLPDNEYMYFVHSFYAKPEDPDVVVSTTKYGTTEFCSSLRFGSVFACQFHPERSGPAGLRIYQNLAELIAAREPE